MFHEIATALDKMVTGLSQMHVVVETQVATATAGGKTWYVPFCHDGPSFKVFTNINDAISTVNMLNALMGWTGFKVVTLGEYIENCKEVVLAP